MRPPERPCAAEGERESSLVRMIERRFAVRVLSFLSIGERKVSEEARNLICECRINTGGRGFLPSGKSAMIETLDGFSFLETLCARQGEQDIDTLFRTHKNGKRLLGLSCLPCGPLLNPREVLCETLLARQQGGGRDCIAFGWP